MTVIKHVYVNYILNKISALYLVKLKKSFIYLISCICNIEDLNLVYEIFVN